MILLLLPALIGTAQEVRHAADRLPAILERVPRLRVAVVFAQDRLVPGDTIPVQINVYDAAGKPFTRRQILHLDLVNEKGSTVHRQNILLADGTADSYLAIPIALAPGGYLVVGYTEFMRNYSEDTFFRREIEVVTDRSMKRPPLQPAIRILPEGGSLVSQTVNRVIIRYQGLPLGSTMEIRGSVSGLMATAYVTAAGVGYADITPQPGEHIEVKHSLVSGILEISEGKHVALRWVGNVKDKHLTMHIPAEKMVRRNQLAMVLVGQGKVERLHRIGSASDSIRFGISEELPAGLYQAIAMDEEGSELAKRFIRLGNDDARLVIAPIKPALGLRESSEAIISVADALGRSLSGRFTAEIVDQRAMVQTAEPDPTDLLLGPDPVGMNIGKNITALERDLLLVTRTGSWLPKGWSERNYEPAFSFQSVVRFSGSVERINGQPLRDSTSIMFFLQRRMLGYEVEIKNGRFDFPVLFDFRGDDELFYVVRRKDSLVRDGRIKFDYDTISTLLPVTLQAQYSRDPFADFVAKKRATDRSYRFFTSGNEKVKSEEPNPNAPFEKELRGADVTIRIDDYVVFPTVEDVVKEIVPGLKHRRIGSRQAVRVFLYSPVVTNDPILSKDDPLYILDGIMTRSTDYFLRINPADLISISIVRNALKLQHFGYLGRNGVVLVRTRKPSAIREFTDNTVLSVKGLNESWKPVVPMGATRIPDLRILLGRAPRLDTGPSRQTSFGFRTGDIPGNFWIRVEGQTSNGSPVVGLQRLEVKMD